MKAVNSPTTPEQVGRRYDVTCYGLLSRRVGGDGKWYGRDNYKDEAEARANFEKAKKASRYEVVGEICVDFGPDNGDRYERKLVKIVKHCEVLDVAVGPA